MMKPKSVLRAKGCHINHEIFASQVGNENQGQFASQGYYENHQASASQPENENQESVASQQRNENHRNFAYFLLTH